MLKIDASAGNFRLLNEKIKAANEDVEIVNCYGDRFIGTGQSGKKIVIDGTPGNALGAYLDGADIEVHGNVQDAVGDTMNDGTIVVHGSAGDALGYAMRGGKIFVKGGSGYRTGIHMKQYKEKCPTIVVGGAAGSFLGEYLAGGLIIVLGIGCDTLPVGNFAGVGMHGGKMYIRADEIPVNLPSQVSASLVEGDNLQDIKAIIEEYSTCFGFDAKDILSKKYLLLTPNAKNPYKQLYTAN